MISIGELEGDGGAIHDDVHDDEMMRTSLIYKTSIR